MESYLLFWFDLFFLLVLTPKYFYSFTISFLWLLFESQTFEPILRFNFLHYIYYNNMHFFYFFFYFQIHNCYFLGFFVMYTQLHTLWLLWLKKISQVSFNSWWSHSILFSTEGGFFAAIRFFPWKVFCVKGLHAYWYSRIPSSFVVLWINYAYTWRLLVENYEYLHYYKSTFLVRLLSRLSSYDRFIRNKQHQHILYSTVALTIII